MIPAEAGSPVPSPGSPRRNHHRTSEHSFQPDEPGIRVGHHGIDGLEPDDAVVSAAAGNSRWHLDAAARPPGGVRLGTKLVNKKEQKCLQKIK